jgi:hypothetical protein
MLTDADGVEYPMAAKRLGYRFLEQCRSLGTPQTVLVAGPVKAILAVRTRAQGEAGAQQAIGRAPAGLPEAVGPLAPGAFGPLAPAPETAHDALGPSRRPSPAPALLSEGAPPPFPDEVEPPLPAPEEADLPRPMPAATIPDVSDPLDQRPTPMSPSPPPLVPEVDEEPEIETEPPLVPTGAAPALPSPARIDDLSARREAQQPRPEGAPEPSAAPQVPRARPQAVTSILLRDEMERTRLAEAGHEFPEGLRLRGLDG